MELDPEAEEEADEIEETNATGTNIETLKKERNKRRKLVEKLIKSRNKYHRKMIKELLEKLVRRYLMTTSKAFVAR